MPLRQQALAARSEALEKEESILDRARVYLSGPMDFIVSREDERRFGWRTRVSQFLTQYGVTVLDPWNKPEVSGMSHYGKEDEFTIKRREEWTYDDSLEGRNVRDTLCDEFWPTLHIDLRMTDLADFLIAYCPTNIYSVGTVHEIATARLQHKPVLLITPRLDPDSESVPLRKHLDERGDTRGLELLDERDARSTTRPNATATPSLWYMAMLGKEDYFFDGFGFGPYREQMGWDRYEPLDGREDRNPPRRPLLPYLEKLNRKIPTTYDAELGRDRENADWLIFIEREVTGGKD